MKVVIIGKYEKDELIPNHPEEIELDLGDVTAFSTDKELRLVGIDKSMCRLSLASYKALKKEMSRRGLLNRFDASKK